MSWTAFFRNWKAFSPRSFARGTGPNRRNRPTPRKLRVEQLEDRTVPSASFNSAIGIGNDIGNSQAVDVAVDTAGNSYLTGSFTGSVDFGPGHTLTAQGGIDIFVAKYASDNTLVWASGMGGVGTDTGNKIVIDGSGNVYVTGQFSGSANFGAVTRTSAGGYDGFVAKLNSVGTVQWANRWGAATTDEKGNGVGVDAAGNVYAFGNRLAAYLSSGNGYDVLKFGPTGAATWAKGIGIGLHPPSNGDLAVDATGNVFVCGSFKATTVDFDPGPKTRNVSSNGPARVGFVLKLDTNGNFSWVSPFIGQEAAAQSIALDGGGNVIVGGWYDGAVDFNPGAGTTTLPTIGGAFITKLNSGGGLVWARALESDNTVFVNGLTVDAAGSIYATGNLYGTVDFDPGAGTQTRTTAGGTDAYVLKLNAAGNFAWAETFGGTENDNGWGVAVDPSGTVYLAGAYHGDVDFDPDPLGTYLLTNPGSFYNMYLVKLNQS